MVLLASLFTSVLISTLGIAGTFCLFCGFTIIGGIKFLKDMKSTYGLTALACKQLFYPENLKTIAL
jgi:hypothetical protein